MADRRWRQTHATTALIGALLAVLLAACSTGAASTSPGPAASAAVDSPATTPTTAPSAAVATPAEHVTVHWLTHNPSESAASEQAAVDMVTAYNQANPNVTVVREAVTGDELKTIITTRMQSGDVDLVNYGTGPGFAGLLNDAGLLEPLDDAYAKYKWPIYDWAKARTTKDGVTYGVPDQIEALGLFYNADLLAELGFPNPPKTLEEFRAIADAAKAKGLIPIAFGNKEQWEGASLFSIGTGTALAGPKLDALVGGTASWDTPEVQAIIKLFFDDFVKSGYYPKRPNGLSYDDANALFFSGKSPFLLTGTWISPDVTANAKFKSGFIPFPSIDGSGTPLSTGLGDGWYVGSKSAHKPETLDFLNWMLQPERGKTQLEVFETIPAYPIDTSAVNVSPLYRSIIDQVSGSASAGSGYNLDVLTPDAFNQQMYVGFQEVIDGKKSVAEQAAALQAAFSKK
jgi:raffinose/stachyose/melibiose transport system substrate-binding protein